MADTAVVVGDGASDASTKKITGAAANITEVAGAKSAIEVSGELCVMIF